MGSKLVRAKRIFLLVVFLIGGGGPPCKSKYAVSILLFSGVCQIDVYTQEWSEEGEEITAVYHVN